MSAVTSPPSTVPVRRRFNDGFVCIVDLLPVRTAATVIFSGNGPKVVSRFYGICTFVCRRRRSRSGIRFLYKFDNLQLISGIDLQILIPDELNLVLFVSESSYFLTGKGTDRCLLYTSRCV